MAVYMPGLTPEVCAQLDTSFKKIAGEIRTILSNHDIGHFNLQLTAHGRTVAGDAHVKYELSEHGYEKVTGRDVPRVTEEFLRRRGFDKANDPLELPAPQGDY